jgi:hypothetical protein
LFSEGKVSYLSGKPLQKRVGKIIVPDLFDVSRPDFDLDFYTNGKTIFLMLAMGSVPLGASKSKILRLRRMMNNNLPEPLII